MIGHTAHYGVGGQLPRMTLLPWTACENPSLPPNSLLKVLWTELTLHPCPQFL